jgi:hypothetical protein
LPLFAVIVRVEVPGADFLAVVIVRVELPEPVSELGLKEAELREGRPVTLSETFPAKSFTATTETAYLTLPPRRIEAETGETDIVKSAAGPFTKLAALDI